MIRTRRCADCRQDISSRGNTATRCELCQDAHRKTYLRGYKKVWNKGHRSSPYPEMRRSAGGDLSGSALEIFLKAFSSDRVKIRAKVLGIDAEPELTRNLTDMQRLIVNLKYGEGKTSFEIANLLRRTEGYVSQELGKAKTQLAQAARDRGGDQTVLPGRYTY